MSLLMTSRPIVINPELAYSIGLNEAIALQQINYWLQETKSGMESDGVRWIYNTTEQWLEQFPFWSESTLKRTFTRLKTLGVLKIEQLNKSQRDMTNFYTINYESELLDEVKVTESKRSKCAVPSGQNDTMEEVKVTHSIRSKRTAVIRSKCTDDPTENTTESTTEITGKDSCPVAGQPDPEVVITDQARQVLSYLNQTTGSRYQVCSTSLENIRARLREQFTVDDLCLVVDYKNADWRDSEQAQYLRPATLFIPKNFPGYLQSATKWSSAGRPERVNGKWETNSASRANFQSVDYSLPENSGFRS
ncbi:TPA: transcriptional regulator [Escherichia coli]|nr:transcriptional regulator [Escherichia coli]HAY5073674.1 transcriptional regulator [Escherichia coli]